MHEGKEVPCGPGVIDGTRPVWRVVASLALPVVAQQILILSVGLSDRFLAGSLQPSIHEGAGATVAYQAAQTTAIYISWLIGGYTTLVTVGAVALVARAIGAGNIASARRIAHMAILLAVCLGLIGTLGGLAGLKSFVEAMQLEGAAAEHAAAYLYPLILLLTFQIVELAGVACLAGAGDTKSGFLILGGVALLNWPLAWGLALGIGPMPRLGFVGIAIGTALSHICGAVAVLAMLARGRAGLRLEMRMFVPDLPLLGRILKVSVPAGVDSLGIMLGHLWYLRIVNHLGDVASSAHGIALAWEALSYQCGIGFGTAAMTIVGQNLGAGKPREAAQGGWAALGLGLVIMSCMGAVFFTFAPQMFQLFCPRPDQASIIEVGVPVLRLVAFAEPALATIVILLSALRGAGDTRVPVALNAIGLFAVRLPLAYYLTQGGLGSLPGFRWGLYGAWLAMFIDLQLRGTFFLARFATGKWQKIRV